MFKKFPLVALYLGLAMNCLAQAQQQEGPKRLDQLAPRQTQLRIASQRGVDWKSRYLNIVNTKTLSMVLRKRIPIKGALNAPNSTLYYDNIFTVTGAGVTSSPLETSLSLYRGNLYRRQVNLGKNFALGVEFLAVAGAIAGYHEHAMTSVTSAGGQLQKWPLPFYSTELYLAHRRLNFRNIKFFLFVRVQAGGYMSLKLNNAELKAGMGGVSFNLEI